MFNSNQTTTPPKGHCTQVYYLGGRKVENIFRCNQRAFSPTDLWRIRRAARPQVVRDASLNAIS